MPTKMPAGAHLKPLVSDKKVVPAGNLKYLFWISKLTTPHPPAVVYNLLYALLK
jgi:hypothetical protein